MSIQRGENNGKDGSVIVVLTLLSCEDSGGLDLGKLGYKQLTLLTHGGKPHFTGPRFANKVLRVIKMFKKFAWAEQQKLLVSQHVCIF